MVLFDGALGVIAFGLWVFCIIDVLTTPRDQVRNLPKLAWVLVEVLLSSIGAVAWLIFGRNWSARRAGLGGSALRGSTPGWSAPGRSNPRRSNPQRANPAARPMSPDDDDEFLASLKTRRNDVPDDPAAG